MDKNSRKITGKVISSKRDKPRPCFFSLPFTHPIYKKILIISSKIHAHDEVNECSMGDVVTIQETKPFSKTKSWKLVSIEKRVKDIS